MAVLTTKTGAPGAYLSARELLNHVDSHDLLSEWERESKVDPVKANAARVMRRIRATGWIKAITADQICCELLGIHPSLLWCEDYWEVSLRSRSGR